jgi:hypothetical protein
MTFKLLISFFVVINLLKGSVSSSLRPNQAKYTGQRLISSSNQPLSHSNVAIKNQLINTLLPTTSIFSALLLATSTQTALADGKLEYQPALTGLGYGKVNMFIINTNQIFQHITVFPLL